MKPGEKTETCTWALPGFPRKLKNRFLSWAKQNDMTGSAWLEYVLNKMIRDAAEHKEID